MNTNKSTPKTYNITLSKTNKTVIKKLINIILLALVFFGFFYSVFGGYVLYDRYIRPTFEQPS